MRTVCSTASWTSPPGRGHERPRLHQCPRTAAGGLPRVQEEDGFYGASRIWYLKQFDAYCTAHERTVFDRYTVEGWVSQQLTRSGRYRSWMSYIHDVGRWLQAHGQRDAYVLSDRRKAALVASHPYLLSTDEIKAFFAAATTPNAASPWRWQAVAFFTLMHSCGLRTGETRLLRPEHVHLRDRNLDIVASKGNRSRRLPITNEVSEILADCDRVTRARFGPTRGTFFVSAASNQVTTATVGKMFNRVWDQAGLPRPVSGQQPRPYDFRHHFAYANVERWMTQGNDVMAIDRVRPCHRQRKLPTLSVNEEHPVLRPGLAHRQEHELTAEPRMERVRHTNRSALREGIRGQSTTRDNALDETVVGLYETECVNIDGPFRTVDELELATLSWVHWLNEKH